MSSLFPQFTTFSALFLFTFPSPHSPTPFLLRQRKGTWLDMDVSFGSGAFISCVIWGSLIGIIKYLCSHFTDSFLMDRARWVDGTRDDGLGLGSGV